MHTPDQSSTHSPSSSGTPIELSLALDGRLSGEQAEAFARQLSQYPHLQRDYARFAEVREVLRAGAALEALPDGFDARLRDRIRDEELKRKAQSHARVHHAGDRWFGRMAIGISGVAAGIAIMLGVGAATSHETEATGDSVAMRGESDVVLAPARPMAMGGDDVAALVHLKYRGFNELSRQLSFGGTFDPLWVKAELGCSGLLEDSQGLLEAIRSSGRPELAGFAPFIESLDVFCREMARHADLAAIQDRELSRAHVGELLAAVRVPEQSAFWHSGDLAQRAIDTVRTGQLRPRSETEELEQYIIARSLFAHGEFRNAADACLSFVSSYPQSLHFDRMGVFAARSLIRIGDATAAARLVEALSRRRPQVLSLFSVDELARMRESTPEGGAMDPENSTPDLRVTLIFPDGSRRSMDLSASSALMSSRRKNASGARAATSEAQIEFLERLKAAEAAKPQSE